MIAINLPLNNIFVGKKLHGIISEGNVKNYSKKHKIKKDFSNQLTIIVKVPNTFICSTDNIEYDTKANESIKNRKRKYIEDDKEYFNVNLKIFGNGKIIIDHGDRYNINDRLKSGDGHTNGGGRRRNRRTGLCAGRVG